ncbi:MAG: dihydroxy-acid dehydratase [Nitrospinota bacterium]|nr:MAG: dihydroxy-acid dehydratase [Nitrospinota bacterium]
MGIGKGLTSYGDSEFSLFIRRVFSKSMGLTDTDLQRPVVGICNTWSELNSCHRHFREVAEAVKRGVWQAGGLPLEFPTISLGEIFLSPTSMLYRNLMAMDTEEMIRAQPLDGVVLLGGCDKTVPAQLMAAASANIPTIMVTGGPMLSGYYQGDRLGACTDCRRFWMEYRAGSLSEEELRILEGALCPSAGHCMVMGTASTMASLTEALGMSLPGCAAIPAPLSERLRLAEESGRQIVALIERDIRPAQIMTPEAFENAIRVLMAIGGSTNAVIHLVAIAGRLGIPLPLDRFDALSRETPVLVDIRPSGRFHMEDLAEAGGIPAVMKVLAPLLHLQALTVTGKTVGENLQAFPVSRGREEVIASLEKPFQPEGGLAIVRGTLAPEGAVIKQSAMSPQFFHHRGRAVVFSSIADLAARIDDPNLEIGPEDIMVLQNAGPVGAPGMPEAGFLPIPKKLLQQGVRDIIRISDARMSGTAFGSVVLHVSPEAAVGGPLALVQTGDEIELDLPHRRLDLLVSEAELQARRARWKPPERPYQRGYGRLFLDHVLQAHQGCDFDFLTAHP